MDKGINTHKKKEMVSKPFKFIIAAASVAGTLGLWGIFSQAEVQNNITATTVDALPTVATLAASAGVTSSDTVVATSNSNTIDVLPVVTQPATTVSQTNSSTGSYAPAPVTSTRSSR
jgi:hypothetical protein